jgi:hypothetical protein
MLSLPNPPFYIQVRLVTRKVGALTVNYELSLSHLSFLNLCKIGIEIMIAL